MQTSIGHLTFCTNIFPGEDWETHFAALEEHVPSIQKRLAPGQPFAIGLRLSNKASLQLSRQEVLHPFKQWLADHHCYVFTINGFPYGNFHHTRVKDQVHAPDWATPERLQYTIRLFRILAALVPPHMEGGVSTSPLSYKHWFDGNPVMAEAVREKSTWNMVQIVSQLYQLKKSSGTVLHLDIEPEPDGFLETWEEFSDWYLHELVPLASLSLQDQYHVSEQEAEASVREHIRLCYDVCHFAIGYEDAGEVVQKMEKAGIRVGKWQLSAALKIKFTDDQHKNQGILEAVKEFDEPTYLHQVVARQKNGTLVRYPDLPAALEDPDALCSMEWRSHFHVPLFTQRFGLLESTQKEVIEVLRLQNTQAVTDHLEVETYTWEVLPGELKVPMEDSIVREMTWVLDQIA